MTWAEKGGTLWAMILERYEDLDDLRERMGHSWGHACRVSDMERLGKKDTVARQWVDEAVEALTASQVLSLIEVRHRFGEKPKAEQLSLL